MKRQVERTREERRELLETTKLSRLPKLQVRNSLDNKPNLKENDYLFDKPNATALSNITIPNPFFKNKVRSVVTIECDSSCHPNPGGLGCIAWVAFNEERDIIEQCCKSIGRGNGITNNVAALKRVISIFRFPPELTTK